MADMPPLVVNTKRLIDRSLHVDPMVTLNRGK
jgi:hypothetical protein